MRMRVGHQGPQPQGISEFPARRRDVSAVHGGTGLHRAGQGGGVGVLDPGLVPLVACRRRQRPFTQRDRDKFRDPAFFLDAEGIGEERIAAVEVTAQDPRRPLHERN
jgi:hypothetical protein